VSAASAAATAAAGWTGFRGPRHDGSATLGASWPDRPVLAVAWKVPLGSGYSGVVGAGGRLVTAWAAEGQDWVGAFDAATGRLLWRAPLGPTYGGHDGSHDGPIATPALAGDRVVMLGPRGVLGAWGLADGRELWRLDLVAVEGVETPLYGFASSPLVVGDLVVVEHGVKGGHVVAAYELTGGARRWQAGGEDVVEYRSPVVAELAGRPQVVALGGKRLLGLDPATGEVLWQHEHGGDESAMAAAAVPLPVGDDRLYLATSFEEGQLLRLARDGAGWKVETVWKSRALGRTYAPPVASGGTLVGYAGTVLAGADVASGERRWRSRPPGDGFPAAVDDRVVVLTKKGTLHVGRIGAEGWSEEASLPLFDGFSWTPPSVVEGRIAARSLGQLASVEVRAAAPETAPHAVASAPGAAPAGGFAAFLAALAASDAKAAAIDAYLAALPPGPVVEGERVHFLYRGPGEDLAIVGDMIGARAQEPMARVEGTDLFHWSTTLAPDALVSYRFVRDYDQPLADPRNPWKVKERGAETSWFGMPAWKRPTFLDGAATRAGRLVRHDLGNPPPPAPEPSASAAAGAAPASGPPPLPARPVVDVWLPPGYADAPAARFPVVYLHQGDAAVEQEYPQLLDRLVGAGTVPPMVVVFVHPFADFQEEEAKGYRAAVATEVVPFVDRTYRTRAERGGRASVAMSFASVEAFLLAFEHPGLFGVVAAQSPAMLTVDQNRILAAVPDPAAHPMQIDVEWGTYDLRAPHEGWNTTREAPQLAESLRRRGHAVRTHEVAAGHGWGSFRSRADRLFASLFAASR
jgi:outer membrane protein assembly factor BamB